MFKIEDLRKYPIYRNYEAIDQLPIFTKDMLSKRFPEPWQNEELSNAIQTNGVEFASTSGTSSERMLIVRKKNWWHEEFKHYYSLHPTLGRLFGAKKVSLTTAICSDTACYREAPTMEKRILNGALYLNINENPFHWNEIDIRRMVGEISQYQPVILDIDPIYFAIFEDKAKQYGIELDFTSVGVITLCYEFVTRSAYESIAKHFPEIPIVNVFGSTETGILFLQDGLTGKMYFSNDRLTLTLSECPNAPGLYRSLVSSRKNQFMPLVNYQTGDLFTKFDCEGECHLSFKGREKELLILNNKPFLPADLDDLMLGFRNKILVYQFEIAQSHLILKLVLKNHEQIQIRQIQDFLADQLNSVAQCSIVSQIQPEKSGKFAIFKSQI